MQEDFAPPRPMAVIFAAVPAAQDEGTLVAALAEFRQAGEWYHENTQSVAQIAGSRAFSAGTAWVWWALFCATRDGW